MPEKTDPSESLWTRPIRVPELGPRAHRLIRWLAIPVGAVTWAFAFGMANLPGVIFIKSYTLALVWYAGVVVACAILVARFMRWLASGSVSIGSLLLACYAGGVLYRTVMVGPALGLDVSNAAFYLASLVTGTSPVLSLAVFAQQVLLPLAVVLLLARLRPGPALTPEHPHG